MNHEVKSAHRGENGDESEVSVRKRVEGESPYDYCLYLIDEGHLNRAEKWINHRKVEEKALRRILRGQLRIVSKLQECLGGDKPKKKKATSLCKMLISPIAQRRFQERIEALAQVSEIQATPAPAPEPMAPAPIASEPQQATPPVVPHSLARGLLIGKLDKKAREYPEKTLGQLTQMIETTWLRERDGKHSLGVGRMDLLVIAECLNDGGESPITLEHLQRKLGGKSESHIVQSVRGHQKNYLRGTGYVLEGDIRGEGVRLIRLETDEAM